ALFMALTCLSVLLIVFDVSWFFFFFFFQAEDGIRDRNVTGVQTCALPILEKLLLTWMERIKMLFWKSLKQMRYNLKMRVLLTFLINFERQRFLVLMRILYMVVMQIWRAGK